MPSDSIHIAPVITTDTLSPILSDSNRIISDSLRTTHPEWDLHYKKDSVKFTPQYAESLSAYCHAPIDNPLTDYKEAALVIPEGFEGIPKIENPSQNDGIFLILLCCFILVATSFRRGIKLFSQPFSASKNNRNRTDMADNSTIIESRLRFILLAQTFVMEGIALRFLIHYLKPELTYIGYFKEILCAAVLATLYYNFQQSAYRILGSIFTESGITKQWIDNHASINLLLGIILFPIIFCMIYLSGFLNIGLLLVTISYILSRIIFIYKGIKIFLRDVYGILYFILYLCALEIMPLFLIYKGVILIYQFVEFKILTF